METHSNDEEPDLEDEIQWNVNKILKNMLKESDYVFKIGQHLLNLYDLKKKQNEKLTSKEFYEYCKETFHCSKITITRYMDFGSLVRIFLKYESEFNHKFIYNEFQARAFHPFRLKAAVKGKKKGQVNIIPKYDEEAVRAVWKYITQTEPNATHVTGKKIDEAVMLYSQGKLSLDEGRKDNKEKSDMEQESSVDSQQAIEEAPKIQSNHLDDEGT
jgi:hypothetical protein